MTRNPLFTLDDRPIQTIHWPGKDKETYTVGIAGVQKITVQYLEEEAVDQPWLAVWVNGKVQSRWNTRYIKGVVHYDRETKSNFQ